MELGVDSPIVKKVMIGEGACSKDLDDEAITDDYTSCSYIGTKSAKIIKIDDYAFLGFDACYDLGYCC